MSVGRQFIILIILFCSWSTMAQNEFIKLAETKEEFIRENHVESIEEFVHQFMNSQEFLNFMLSQGHDIDPNSVQLRKRDIGVGEDLDVYVKHITEHQNFTLLLIPFSIYSLQIYDTLLFSVLEVSDQWMADRFFNSDLDEDSVKSQLLTVENHILLTDHLSEMALANNFHEVNEIKITLRESYISTTHLPLHVKDLDESERKQLRKNWGLMKKAMAHNIEMNVEMNVYLFGNDDMSVIYNTRRGERVFRVTPNNIFPRHEFLTGG